MNEGMHKDDNSVGMSEEEQRISILNALGMSLASKRKEAVGERQASGIEDEWQGDEEFYQGYDENNRHEFVNTAAKPLASGGTSQVVDDDRAKIKGSIVFPNITQPYVDAVSARVGDMLLPTGDRNFAIESTPIPEMLEEVFKKVGVEMPPPAPAAPVAQPAKMPAAPMPGQAAGQMMPPTAPPEAGGMAAMMGGQPPQAEQAAPPDPKLAAIEELRVKIEETKADAERKAKNAENQIDDYLAECQYQAELRKVIDDAAKLGSGVIKGPVPVKRKTSIWQTGPDGVSALVMVEEIKPASFRVDPWNLFPDPACGESIHNGSYIFERDYFSQKRLEELKGLPGYIDSQIDLVIEQGPLSYSEADQRNNMSYRSTKGQFEVWYVHVQITADELMAAGCDCDGKSESYPAQLTLVNDQVIRAALNPLDSGAFPYDVIPWKRRPNIPWGMGLARQLRTPQRIVVGATRRLMDNAGLASGPQIIVRRDVEPEDGSWEIAPLKIWVEDKDAAGNPTDPVKAVIIPMLQVELTNIIQLGMKMAEDVTGMPMLMQGQQGSAPDTVGGMVILNNNSHAVLRRIARLFDTCITEPHIRRYYDWLMEYGEDDSAKGDFQIVARGSTALVERDIQSQEMINVLQLSANPIYKKNPAKAMDEFLKSRRFDPAAFDYTEAELKELQQQQPAPAPQIEAAQIRAKADAERTDKQIKAQLQVAQMTNQTAQQRIITDTDRDTIYVQAEAQSNQMQHAAKMEELATRRELALLDYANREKVSLEQVKSDLAQTAMKLNLQRELAVGAAALDKSIEGAPQVATPAMEPAGQAPDGQAFQK